MKVLVTGAAGFIGFHLSRKLLAEGHQVIGLDSLSDYYDVRLKQARLDLLKPQANFRFVQQDLVDAQALDDLFRREAFEMVVNLAAQAGVRYSLEHPLTYIDSNCTGFTNILECCRHHPVQHLVYASSSSVYGLNQQAPFSEHHGVDHPLSIYAATKRANELLAHSYSHLFGIPTTGLRFFTVYGPWGRPDMALFKFTKAMLAGEEIEVYNRGNMVRDFTYIDDIVEGVARVMQCIPAADEHWDKQAADPASSSAPYRIFNIGNNNPVQLNDFIEAIEHHLGIQAKRKLLPMQPGDVPSTSADVADLVAATGFKPSTSVQTGIARFVDWYLAYYQQQKPGS